MKSLGQPKIKKGDTVLVIAGSERGKKGLVEALLGRRQQVIVAGCHKYQKHVRPSRKNPHGGKIEAVRPIAISSVMVLDSAGHPSRVGFLSDGSKVRIAKTNRQELSK